MLPPVEVYTCHIIKPFDKESILAANSTCKLIPPIKEKAFKCFDLCLINACFSLYFAEEYEWTLVLHKKSKSIVLNGDLYGTYFSRQKNSYLIIIRNQIQSGEILKYPCFILGFIKCTAFNKLSTYSDLISTNGTEFILLRVIPLQEHHQRYYYPQPVEVWRMPNPDFLMTLIIMLIFIYLVYSASVHILCLLVIVYMCVTVVPCNRYSGIG